MNREQRGLPTTRYSQKLICLWLLVICANALPLSPHLLRQKHQQQPSDSIIRKQDHPFATYAVVGIPANSAVCKMNREQRGLPTTRYSQKLICQWLLVVYANELPLPPHLLRQKHQQQLPASIMHQQTQLIFLLLLVFPLALLYLQ